MERQDGTDRTVPPRHGATGRRPTSRDVAQLAGVSHTAVSFVFNGRAKGNLSERTQERIRAAAEQLGYRPNAVARGLRRSRTAVVGLITDEIASSPFAGRLLRGAMETAWNRDHLVVTVDSGGDPEKEEAAVTELLDRRVDGIVYAAMSLRPVTVPDGLRRTRTVLANCLADDGSLPAVIPAERAGGHAAAQVLLDAGHRRIASVGGLHTDDIASAERLLGFREALGAAGVAVDDGWIVRGGGEISSGYQGSLALLAEVPAARRPTGVVCFNDRVAAGVLHAAARLGLRVPEDLSVVGYDDQEHMAAYLSPPLTTVALPHRAMGEAAVRLLLDAIDTETEPPVTVHRLRCDLVSRGSVGPAPSP
jgi:LacI family transcriptional regulator